MVATFPSLSQMWKKYESDKREADELHNEFCVGVLELIEQELESTN